MRPREVARRLADRIGPLRDRRVLATFHNDRHLDHTMRRLEHLAGLGLPTDGRTVLEVGAGIGDLSTYYIARGNAITVTEARGDNLKLIRRRFPPERYPDVRVAALDLEAPALDAGPFDVVHCYGVLYHLEHPAEALEFLAGVCREMMLVETCVSYGDDERINALREPRDHPSQAVSGTGCRPTRPWVFGQLRRHFEHVYVTRTQPHHPEFPLDWSADRGAEQGRRLARSVFVASRRPIDNPQLSPELLVRQTRQA